jgi:hypothetical protein
MKDQMRRQAWRAMLGSAFFSLQSAVIIALSLLLFGAGIVPFEGWAAWYWLVFGALAEGVYVGATVTDPAAARRAVNDMLTEQYDPDRIQNADARARLKHALEYRRLITEAALRHAGPMRTNIEATASEINDWIEQIYQLARRIDAFAENEIISRDRRIVPNDLKTLRHRLHNEKDSGVRAELEEAIQTKETQLANLRSLENHIKRADIQLDHTLAALGTIYTQVQLIDVKDVDSGRAQRLQQEIHEEVASLQDTLSAIDEVHRYQGYAAGSER